MLSSANYRHHSLILDQIKYQADSESIPVVLQLDADLVTLADEISREINAAVARFGAGQGIFSSSEMSELITKHDGTAPPDDIAANSTTNLLHNLMRSEMFSSPSWILLGLGKAPSFRSAAASKSRSDMTSKNVSDHMSAAGHKSMLVKFS